MSMLSSWYRKKVKNEIHDYLLSRADKIQKLIIEQAPEPEVVKNVIGVELTKAQIANFISIVIPVTKIKEGIEKLF